MKIIKGILITLVALIVLVTVIGFFSPQKVHVERSQGINASSEIVHEQINNLSNWANWSPWHEMDPQMKIEYNSIPSGAGASYKWQSEKLGNGEFTIISGNADSITTVLNMDFGTSFGKFVFSRTEEGVNVTWSMEKENGMNPWARFLGLFMNGMLGNDFEKGLSKLKAFAEAVPKGPKTYGGYEVMEKDAPEMVYIGKKDSVSWAGIGEFLKTNLPKIFEEIGKQKLEPVAAPSGIFFSWDTVKQSTVMAAAIAVKGDQKNKVKGYETFVIPAGKLLHIAYFGAYEKTTNAHYGMDAYMREKNLLQNGPVVEEYVTDPAAEPDTAQWLTNIYYRVK